MIQNIIENNQVQTYVTWLIFTYGAVTAAMIVDFITGVKKAKKANIATRSRGYKMTCTKAGKYFFPMLCLTCIDVMGAVVLSFPAFTMLMAAFNIFCEWKSVMESTHDKEEIRDAEETMKVIIKNKEDIAKLIMELMKIKKDNDEDSK